jgi:polysaccharide export outer membrane protein
MQARKWIQGTLIVVMTAALVEGCASAPAAPAIGETASMEQETSLAMGAHAEQAVYRTETKKAPKPVPDPEIDPDALLRLGSGDAVSVQVYGRPEMSTTTYVSDQGTIEVPLAGEVQVAGLTPAKASHRVAEALRDGQYLLDPHVSITLTSYKSAQVSVLGEIHTPGRFSIESRTTALDLLAQAGGPTENASDVIYVLRPDGKGNVARFVIDLNALRGDGGTMPTLALRGGDSVYVPRADAFYIYGEVHTPNMYRLEPGMNVLQAIARGGGITPRGSARRVEISRHTESGELETFDAKPTDTVQPNDVIRVKERLF